MIGQLIASYIYIYLYIYIYDMYVHNLLGSGNIGIICPFGWLHYSLIARFMGPTWGPPGAARTQVDPMLATQALLFGLLYTSDIAAPRCQAAHILLKSAKENWIFNIGHTICNIVHIYVYIYIYEICCKFCNSMHISWDSGVFKISKHSLTYDAIYQNNWVAIELFESMFPKLDYLQDWSNNIL